MRVDGRGPDAAAGLPHRGAAGAKAAHRLEKLCRLAQYPGDLPRTGPDRKSLVVVKIFGGCELGDARRTKRLMDMGERLARQSGASMAKCCSGDPVAQLGSYPSATACFLDDLEACIAHLHLPIAHRCATRTTNMLERLFGEERRRTKVIPHAFGERAALRLMYAALIRASQTWKRLVISEFELKQLQSLREHLNRVYAEHTAPVKLSASCSRNSNNERT